MSDMCATPGCSNKRHVDIDIYERPEVFRSKWCDECIALKAAELDRRMAATKETPDV